MTYLDGVVILLPALLGLVVASWLGPNRGVLIGGVATVVAVFALLILQVTPPNLSSAWGLMQFESIRWIPAFLVGAAIGSLIRKFRHPKPPTP